MGVQERLVEVLAVERGVEPASRVAAPGKVFRDYPRGQSMLLPPSLDEWLLAGHVARFVDEMVEQHLNLGPLNAAHNNSKRFTPYDLRTMLKVLLCGHLTEVRSSRKIEAACVEQVALRFLAAHQCPDHRAFSRFRRRHLAAMESLFVQVLGLCHVAALTACSATPVKPSDESPQRSPPHPPSHDSHHRHDRRHRRPTRPAASIRYRRKLLGKQQPKEANPV